MSGSSDTNGASHSQIETGQGGAAQIQIAADMREHHVDLKGGVGIAHEQIATDPQALLAREVPGGHVEPGDLRRAGRQEAARPD